MPGWVYVLLTVAFVPALCTETDWTKNCNKCFCIWVSGKKTANCSHRDFSEIPKDMSSELRDIDFSNNPLHSIGEREFVIARLTDMHKLRFQNCSIDIIDENAFLGLKLLIELDLSRNNFDTLKRHTFRELVKIRIMTLSHNRIATLQDGLFRNLTYLKTLLLDNNRIESINENTFQDLPALTTLNLDYNNLKTVNFDLTEILPKLNSLNVVGNPWVCDCVLEPFRVVVTKKHIITQVTECVEPPKLKGVSWLSDTPFACSPVIVEPSVSTHFTVTTNNITLTCKVSGNPEPDVDWMTNGLSVERDQRKGKHKYITARSKDGLYTWNNLTIINLSYKDRGDYRCVAKNPGGQDEKNVTLLIDNEALLGVVTGMGVSTILIICLSIGMLVLLLLIVFLVVLFCRKNHGNFLQNKRRDYPGNSSSECVNMSGVMDYKKSLITEVNPICKPPRTTVPDSVITGGTEVSDVKRNLLDNESVFECDDESRSLDFDQPLLRKSHNTLLEEYRLNNAPYPPDLLPYPHTVPQLSPAGSNASTVVIDSRLPPPHGPQSPIHNPIYDNAIIYRTLPNSRSHSPFIQGTPLPKIPRQGYVTIPRRPRQQSWSSEPPPTLEGIGEPLYDNLGARTTADGSSVLSLNKVGTETPRSNRMFPISPTTIDPIVETHESSSTSVPNYSENEGQPGGTMTLQPKPRTSVKPQPAQRPVASQTLPRNLNSTKLTPSRTQWAMDNADQLRTPSEKRNSIAGDTPSSENKPKKIPPRPPPKPKKRASAGPLFEDEGEDGTEV
ncbi:uncharacterized protein LOC143204830 [Rhynchophorus ferrugineus]